MARDLSCPSGYTAYKTKRAALHANPGLHCKRCKRCRWWHALTRKRRKITHGRPGT